MENSESKEAIQQEFKAYQATLKRAVEREAPSLKRTIHEVAVHLDFPMTQNFLRHRFSSNLDRVFGIESGFVSFKLSDMGDIPRSISTILSISAEFNEQLQKVINQLNQELSNKTENELRKLVADFVSDPDGASGLHFLQTLGVRRWFNKRTFTNLISLLETLRSGWVSHRSSFDLDQDNLRIFPKEETRAKLIAIYEEERVKQRLWKDLSQLEMVMSEYIRSIGMGKWYGPASKFLHVYMNDHTFHEHELNRERFKELYASDIALFEKAIQELDTQLQRIEKIEDALKPYLATQPSGRPMSVEDVLRDPTLERIVVAFGTLKSSKPE